MRWGEPLNARATPRLRLPPFAGVGALRNPQNTNGTSILVECLYTG